MREYKFRVWNGNKIIYVGSPKNDTTLHLYENGWMVTDHFTGEHKELCSDSNGTLMQFTGLKDKNNKGIYEGDILASTINDRLYNWLIEFKDGCFVFVNIGIDGGLWDRFKVDVGSFIDRQIIGNQYENPELLK